MGGGSSIRDGAPGTFGEKYMKTSTVLGTGAFSKVFLAIDLTTTEKCAVKIIDKKRLHPDEYKLLLMEIEILSSMECPHIIKLFATFEEKDKYMLVTEIMDGGELFDRIVHKSSYNENEARDAVRTMLGMLVYLADRGVVHRDLKPENLLLKTTANDHELKLADFGFAKKVDDIRPGETPCGTPGYVAPEVLRGDSYGCEADVWSLGVIVYVLLGGYPPFYDENQTKLFEKIRKARYHFHEEYWSHISEEAVDLIRSMLTLDQKKRWTARQLLDHPWLKIDTELLAARDLTGTCKVMRKFNARRRLKAAAASIIAANRMAGLSNLRRENDLNLAAVGLSSKAQAVTDEKTYTFFKKGDMSERTENESEKSG